MYKKVDNEEIRLVPNKFKTPEMCMVAVKENWYALEFVPDEMKTPEMCMVAIEEDLDALEFVPEKFNSLVKHL